MRKLFILMYLLTASAALAGGLYNQATQPVAGDAVVYRRSAYMEVDNPLGRPPSIQFANEDVKLYPDGETVTKFARRVTLDSAEYPGAIPLLHPETGQQVGETSAQQLYVILYSLFVFAEQESDRKALLASQPATLIYTTNGTATVPP